jgi:protease YdgD
MRQTLLAGIISLLPLAPLVAQESGLVTLQTRQASTGWEAVGRLDILDQGFCTAALINDRLILTAAHCVYDETGRVIAADRFTFRAGLRDGRAAATRGIQRATAHPDYIHGTDGVRLDNVAVDIAVLELDLPIREARLQPYLIADPLAVGADVGVVSYGRGRAQAASLQEVCAVLASQSGIMIMTCDVDHGSSGAPVFVMHDGQARIASVVSAMAQVDGRKVALGTQLDGPLQDLLQFSATPPAERIGGTQQILQSGHRNNTGAKFITVGP